MKAKLLGIAVKPVRLQPMQLRETGELSLQAGLVGDSRGKPGPRQVTLLSLAAWHTACNEIGVILPWTERRANLLVGDLPLYQSAGSRIVIGDAVLEITGETDPCERMTAVHPKLFDALVPEWRGGVCCRVLRGGAVTLGMEIELASANEIAESG
ncbi:molybdenum cofactor biosysynthesis protein [Sulfurimicrobium lacus]|uniref:Molybdenum cofactor biosysynthesis protein n=1 Tax=Sulfurimicrobium lacus TaxID=2715678 RepID=A0A6F8VDT9_9PROT|nr:MOSC domain-containing protein [Sulfurimicrobium lacus]BCB27844.1 molybdenum cofactor biosysynthesis protein [Sulfurimicrobium lacus]